MQIQVAGHFCYKNEEQYIEFKKIFTDSGKLPIHYSDWKRSADNLMNHYKGSGVKILEVYTEVDDFVLWCRTHGHDLNSDGRKAYANMRAGDYIINSR